MDPKTLTVAALVVAVFLLGSGALVGAALLVARSLILDRFFKQWGAEQEPHANGMAASGGRWSFLGSLMTVLGVVVLVAALSAILGTVEPANMLNSSWAIAICCGILVGFIGIAIGSSPRRAKASTQSGEETHTVARVGPTSIPAASARRAA
jgi:MFS family permease